MEKWLKYRGGIAIDRYITVTGWPFCVLAFSRETVVLAGPLFKVAIPRRQLAGVTRRTVIPIVLEYIDFIFDRQSANWNFGKTKLFNHCIPKNRPGEIIIGFATFNATQIVNDLETLGYSVSELTYRQ